MDTQCVWITLPFAYLTTHTHTDTYTHTHTLEEVHNGRGDREIRLYVSHVYTVCWKRKGTEDERLLIDLLLLQTQGPVHKNWTLSSCELKVS